jgi:predicted transcriptional regulator of viral defense system
VRSAHHPRADPRHSRPMPQTTGRRASDETYRHGSGPSAVEDGVIARIAESQHGLVTLDQLEALGVSASAVRKRVERGRLHSVHTGVYAVGHALLSREGSFLAATLACGPRALLSHHSAAELWGLTSSMHRKIDVTAPNRRGRIPVGIVAHRDGALCACDRTELGGIPCTTVARTLLDLAALVPRWELRKAVAEAEVRGLLRVTEVRGLIRRCRGRRGVARLRLCIDELDPSTKRTRSELERMFLGLCRRAGLPRPEVNVPLEAAGLRLRPDFLWREARLIIETDSREFHGTASAFELDREREQRFFAAGWQVVRCTWRQVEHNPQALIRLLRAGFERTQSKVDGPGTRHIDTFEARRRRG